MKKILTVSVLATMLIVGTTAIAGDHKPGQRHNAETPQKSGAITPDTTPVQNSAETKRLPGVDCKLYEGGTRQHAFPQYEIGNPNRPECPPVKG